MIEGEKMIEEMKCYCDELEWMNLVVDLEGICEDGGGQLMDVGVDEEWCYFRKKGLWLKSC